MLGNNISAPSVKSENSAPDEEIIVKEEIDYNASSFTLDVPFNGIDSYGYKYHPVNKIKGEVMKPCETSLAELNKQSFCTKFVGNQTVSLPNNNIANSSDEENFRVTNYLVSNLNNVNDHSSSRPANNTIQTIASENPNTFLNENGDSRKQDQDQTESSNESDISNISGDLTLLDEIEFTTTENSDLSSSGEHLISNSDEESISCTSRVSISDLKECYVSISHDFKIPDDCLRKYCRDRETASENELRKRKNSNTSVEELSDGTFNMLGKQENTSLQKGYKRVKMKNKTSSSDNSSISDITGSEMVDVELLNDILSKSSGLNSEFEELKDDKDEEELKAETNKINTVAEKEMENCINDSKENSNHLMKDGEIKQENVKPKNEALSILSKETAVHALHSFNSASTIVTNLPFATETKIPESDSKTEVVLNWLNQAEMCIKSNDICPKDSSDSNDSEDELKTNEINMDLKLLDDIHLSASESSNFGDISDNASGESVLSRKSKQYNKHRKKTRLEYKDILNIKSHYTFKPNASYVFISNEEKSYCDEFKKVSNVEESSDDITGNFQRNRNCIRDSSEERETNFSSNSSTQSSDDITGSFQRNRNCIRDSSEERETNFSSNSSTQSSDSAIKAKQKNRNLIGSSEESEDNTKSNNEETPSAQLENESSDNEVSSLDELLADEYDKSLQFHESNELVSMEKQSQEFSYLLDKENCNELDLLDDIIDSDMAFSGSEFDSDSDNGGGNSKQDKEKKKSIAQNGEKNISNGNDNWRNDPLLKCSLNEVDGDGVISMGEETELLKLQDEENKRLQCQMDRLFYKNGDLDVVSLSSSPTPSSATTEIVDPKIDDIFQITDSSDNSDVEIIEQTATEDSQVKGRRNIRAVLENANLEETTIRANQREKAHMTRLKEKKKIMEKVLSQSTRSHKGLVLDATDDNVIIEVNEFLTKRLKPHQTKGVQFMWDACYETVKTSQKEKGSGCILAHCMGLGKTFQVITLIHTLFKFSVMNLKHVLILCPVSVVLNWKHEFDIAINEAKEDPIKKVLAICVANKSKASRMQLVLSWRLTGGVLIMGYETYTSLLSDQNEQKIDEKLQSVIKALVAPGPDLIICDEGHLLKSDKTIRTQALMKIQTKRRIVLTGTPMQNNLNEYYHMVQFVKPNLLGTQNEYKNRFTNPIHNGQYDDSTPNDIILMKQRSYVLHNILKNTVQRYEVSELKKYLPNQVEYALSIKLHPLQIALYKEYMNKIHEKALFADYHMLQPLCSHPYLLIAKENKHPKNKPINTTNTTSTGENLDETEQSQSNQPLPSNWWKSKIPADCASNYDYGPKLKIMLSLVNECIRKKDKVLIFSMYTFELDVIEKFLKQSDKSWESGETYLRMDGHLPSHTRQKYCNIFNSPHKNAKVFLISYKVGGLGLNLQAANRVILMDVCWNPSYETQSIFRIYRFGQTKCCYIYRLVSMGTMEEVIYERSVTKQAIARRVVDKMQITRHYKCSDLLSMYRCNLDYPEERPTPKLPSDDVLASLLQTYENDIFKYHEHQSLLENLPHEELDETQVKLAWEEFNKAKEHGPTFPQNPPPMASLTQQQPSGQAGLPSNNLQPQYFPIRYDMAMPNFDYLFNNNNASVSSRPRFGAPPPPSIVEDQLVITEAHTTFVDDATYCID